ncbi:MAG: hypothetical protein GWP10_19210 [Nitrospiraceae bacterium]|nr:hypothetical protein [Nitrospiraceae bacterium]
MKVEISSKELKNLTRNKLYEISRKLNVRGRSRMKKKELLKAVEREILIAKESSKEEPITSNFIPVERVEVREGKELKLPEFKEEFVALIPVNPELEFAVWNASGDKGKLRVLVNGKLVFESEVKLPWRKYYIKVKAPFEKVEAELIIGEKVLRSNAVTAPSEKIVFEAGGREIAERIAKEKQIDYRGIRL